MHHHAGIAVVVAQKVVHGQIADHLVLINGVVQSLLRIQFAQGFDQARLILLADLCFGVIEDVAVAVRIVVGIDQLYIVIAHAEAEAARRKAALGLFGIVSGCAAGRGRGLGARAAGGAEIALRHGGRRLRRAVLRSGVIRIACLLQLIKAEIAPIAAAAAKGHAVGLVQFAPAHAVAIKEGFLHALDGQIKPPGLAVHVDLHIAAQRGGHAHAAHQRIGQVVLHHGGVLNQVIQAQLIQAVIGHALDIVVKLYLEGIARGAHGGHGGKGGIALGTDGDVAEALAVDGDAAFCVFLRQGVFDKLVPVRHGDIDGMHPALVKKQPFIADCMAAVAAHGCHHAPQTDGDKQRQRRNHAGDAIRLFCSQHGITPYNRRYRIPAPRCLRRPFQTGW